MSLWFVVVALLLETTAITAALMSLAIGLAPALSGELKTAAVCILFGGLGGCTYCLRGVYLTACVQKAPESTAETRQVSSLASIFETAATRVISILRALWGEESFSTEETSAENEMSVVQFANLLGKKILLTGDVGRAGLTEAADFAPTIGLSLPGIDRFQVPHHGSRRNVSTEVLDRWLGQRLHNKPNEGEEKFTAVISSAKADEDHPRKAVIRAMIHRGAKVISTEGLDVRTSHNAPDRDGWGPAKPMQYPEEQED